MNLTQLPAKTEEAVSSVLKDITPEMKNSFRNILIELFSLSLEMPGKLNYTQLERMGMHTEKTYRTAFNRDVDWEGFNEDSIFQVFSPSDRMSIVIDPSFIQKSGKCTPCTGLYWSGVAGAVKHGLEINAIGVSDLDRHDCMILTAPLTPSAETRDKENVSLRKWYLLTVTNCRERLMKISTRVTADAFFATKDFCDGLRAIGFNLISRLHDNAYLRYPHKADPEEKRRKGRPQQYDGKVDIENPDMTVFREFTLDGVKGRFITATLNSRSLGRNVVVTIYYPPKGKPKIYFSTDLALTGEMVAEFYKLRFQIEFCLRDAKQFTGLGNSQARKYRAMGFAINLSFAALNMAKLVIHKENLGISIGQFHLIMMVLATVSRFNSRFAEPPTSKKLVVWDKALRELAGASAIPA